MKKKYEQPEAEITSIKVTNIFTESGNDDNDDGNVRLPLDKF